MSESPLPRTKKPKGLREAIPGLRRLLPHVRPHLRQQRLLIAGGGGAMALEVVMRLLEPWPMKFVIDGVIGQLGADLSGPQPENLQQVLLLDLLRLKQGRVQTLTMERILKVFSHHNQWLLLSLILFDYSQPL